MMSGPSIKAFFEDEVLIVHGLVDPLLEVNLVRLK